jgi:serine protease AprX
MDIRFRQWTGGLALLSLAFAADAATIQRSLQDKLALARPTDTFQVVVTFKGRSPPTQAQLDRLHQIGVHGYHFERLPMAGVVATPAQVAKIARMTSVLSIWNNDPRPLANAEARAISSVDFLQSDPALRNVRGLPFTGRGVGVLVNDSGIDGTHADLSYPDHVVQNVLGHTNLAAQNDIVGIFAPEAAILPVSYTQNVPNSDVLGSHGTHVAGIVGASGAMSNGKYRGVAPGANLVGYGSGVAISVLDAMGGYDYALSHQYQYNIRVINNSFGCGVGCSDEPFDPTSPDAIATKMLADNDIIPVFAAGNDGPSGTTILDGYKKAPWVMVIAAGTKDGRLTDFSSRGTKNYQPQTFTMDGETFQSVDQPLVTAPGNSIISTRAKSADGVGPVYGGGIVFDTLALLDETIEPQYAPFYTHDSGTSMASPHVAGIVALMMEANPKLHWRDVRRILAATATAMPGLADWEAGAGYVNAHAAVAMALKMRTDYAAVNKILRPYISKPLATPDSGGDTTTLNFTLHYDPGGDNGSATFDVPEGITTITAIADSSKVDGFVGADLYEPDGTAHYAGCVTDCVTATEYPNTVAAKAGTWTVKISGAIVGGPEGGEPADVPVTVKLDGAGGGSGGEPGFSGLSDITGHAQQAFILAAIGNRLMDTYNPTRFYPDLGLRRIDLAKYLAMSPGLRLELPLDRQPRFTDLSATLERWADVATAPGAFLKSKDFSAAPALVVPAGGPFTPGAPVSRSQLAYSLVQALGLGAAAAQHTGAVYAHGEDGDVEVADVGGLDDLTRGYIQQAINLQLLTPELVTTPTPLALVHPARRVTRGDYAAAAVHASAAYGALAPPDYIDEAVIDTVTRKLP